MAETIAPSQTPQQSSSVRESASPRGPETDVQPVAVPFGQKLPGILRRAKLDIGSLAPAEFLTLQRTIGNQAVLRLIASARQYQRNGEVPLQSSPPHVRGAVRPLQPLQVKLTIGAPDDVYEKEADSVAEEVMSRATPELRRKCACGGGSEEECPDCRTKRVALQRLSSGGDAGLEAPSMVEDVLATPGQPLAELTRRTLEPGFGHDFSHVRVHEGSKAAESASAVNAVAYTVGNHIVFGEGHYAPGTNAGHHLLAHELTHTIQQTGGRPLGSHLARLAQAKAGLVQRDADTPTNQTPASAPANQTPDDSGPVSLPPITGVGEPEDFHMEGGCDGLRLHGVTDGTFDGGRFNLINEVVAKSDGCNCAKGVQCLHVTGTLVTDYSVSVTIAMPSAPSGLTDCEQSKVQDFLQNVLMPHERDHQTRLMTYNGQTQNPIDITGCGRDEILNKVKAIQGAENAARKAAARALSAAIDPFQRSVDCSDCQKHAGVPDAGSGASPDARAPSAGATRPDAGG